MPSRILTDTVLSSTPSQPIKSPLTKLQLLSALVSNVGSEDEQNLPTEAHCLAHLALLESFVGLKIQVEISAQAQGMTAEAGWARYLKKSAAKFTDWVSSQSLSKDEVDRLTILPELDVLMVWHAFMLSPLKYTKFERMTNMKLPRRGIAWDLIIQSIHAGSYKTDNSADILESLMNVKDESNSTAECFQFTTSAGLITLPFNLEAAVQRHFSFSLKMVQLAWNHSPCATDTMRRSVDRYTNFFSLTSLSPSTSIIPTIDIDLVWHTHQLNPEKYRIYSASVTGGRVINHNENVRAEILAPSYAATCHLFRTTFGVNYSLCYCWACETGRSGGVVNLAEIERLVKIQNSRRKDSGLIAGTSLAMPACDECGMHPERGCHRPGGGPVDGNCGNCGSSPCTCKGGCGQCSSD